MDTSTLLTFVGLGLFFFLMSSGSEIPALIKEHLRQQHIEQIIAQLPQAERREFIDRYLKEQHDLQARTAS